jgi:hypothetical protein
MLVKPVKKKSGRSFGGSFSGSGGAATAGGLMPKALRLGIRAYRWVGTAASVDASASADETDSDAPESAGTGETSARTPLACNAKIAATTTADLRKIQGCCQ